MRTNLKLLAVTLGVVLVVGALSVGVAAAQTPAPPSGGYHQAVVAKMAAILGVSEQRLNEAFVQAHSQVLDDAVKAGQLTQQQADFMKQRQQWMLQNGFGPGMMGGYGPGMMRGHFGGGYGPMMGGAFGGAYGGPWWAAPTATPTR